MTLLLTGVALVFVVEGLALALAPSRIETVLSWLAAMGRDRRRVLGLIALATGIALLWAVHHLH